MLNSFHRIEKLQKSAFIAVVLGPGIAIALSIHGFLPSSMPDNEKYLCDAVALLLWCNLCFMAGMFSQPSIPVQIASALLLHSNAKRAAVLLAGHLKQVEQGQVGASHCVDVDETPSALSTSYVLRALLMSGSEPRKFELDKQVAFLTSQRCGAGWKATNQSKARPEITADVLLALRPFVGESAIYLEAQNSLVEAVTSDLPSLLPTYVATSVYLCLSLSTSASASAISTLREQILSGHNKEKNNHVYWTQTLGPERLSQVASVASTARALIALGSAQEHLTQQAHILCNNALNWLACQPRLENETTQVVRKIAAYETETLVNRHFTSALVLQAACLWKAHKEGLYVVSCGTGDGFRVLRER